MNTMNLDLTKEHYTFKKNKEKSKMLVKGYAKKEQNLLVYDETETEVKIYDGKIQKILTFQEFDNYDKDHNFCYKSNTTDLSLEEFYNDIIGKANTLKEETGGLINLKQCNYNLKIAILKYFYDMTKSVELPDPITQLEANYIIESFQGAIMFAKSAELDNAYQYDINSAYLYFLASNSFRVPIKEGKFTQLTELPKILTYGIYRCQIHKSESQDINRIFRFNSDNKYTHFDINCARLLNLKIELIIDDQANALLYGAGCCINGCKIFKHMIERLYGLKNKKVPLAKDLMILFWGALCEYNKVKTVVTPDEEVHIPDGCRIKDIHPYRNGWKVSYYESENAFKLDYARLGPFLTSAVRFKIAKDVYQNVNHIYRIYTDSILSDIPLNNLKVSNELGDYKLEKSGKCIVTSNGRRPTWY
jgi:hypothetical protein